ncbi:ATP-binding protein [Marinicauda pacifica]|jgi:ABC transport system ATP-binding/permease protein|uniref:ATP-binding protein Uup n=1 Tax=Marinicauda pacifica TaxID=1133559 RepID=A0A4S2HB01_9PROT|nr:ATP-binding cassette domain-containing protein [Marinicauda pacifica]TGY93066.1 ATP-binding cassette domain-containing protein [Marinicauda pacifica]GGE42525.1 ATP-binding protein [Marinicauda pacifica]
MAPPLLTLQDIHLTFGASPLLAGAELSIEAGDRLCLVGRNGSGKSSLMKVAAGLVEPDDGERFFQPNTTIRYLEQDPDLSSFKRVIDYVEDGLAPGDEDYRATYLLEALGLSGEEAPSRLSGGEARRAALARALAPDPDILMLDEPTNHLDLPAIEWLESELKARQGAIVLISHDRRFMENLTRAVVWLDRGTTRRLNKGFAHFEDWRDEVFAAEETEQHKLDRQIAREEDWMRYGVTARRKRNQRRLADFRALKDKRRTHRGPQGQVSLEVSEADTSGKRVVEAKHISKRFGDRSIVDDLSIRISRGDRLAIVGPNGAGKTTLINLMIGNLEPDSGTIQLGTNLEVATLDQRRAALQPGWTLADALTQGGGDQVDVAGKTKHVMAYMKDFLFRPEQARTPVEVLSGGEKARLMLARSLALPSNMLILDEPTNDLDLETLDLLQDMIADYSGTVILVSHDRDFIDRIASSTLMFEGQGKWQEYAGGYSDMLAQRGEGVKARKSEEKKAGPAKTAPASTSITAAKNRAKLSFKDKYALETLPGEIEALSARIKTLEAEMADPALFSRNPERFDAASREHADALTEKAAKEERWLELEMLREEIEG